MKNQKLKHEVAPMKEVGEPVPEVKEELPKKNFYFVVRQPFDNYKRGEHILDFDEIERIEKQRLLSLVMKVNL